MNDFVSDTDAAASATTAPMPDPACWHVGDVVLRSRFLLGSAGYPSPQVLHDAVVRSGAEVVTVALRRVMAAAGDNGHLALLDRALRVNGARVLPNTAGCRTAARWRSCWRWPAMRRSRSPRR